EAMGNVAWVGLLPKIQSTEAVPSAIPCLRIEGSIASPRPDAKRRRLPVRRLPSRGAPPRDRGPGAGWSAPDPAPLHPAPRAHVPPARGDALAPVLHGAGRGV